jgi:CBS domain-containing protein
MQAMQQTVRDWMKDVVIFVEPNCTVFEALSLMRHRYVNSVIVNKTEESPEYGIVTSIDICDQIVAQGRDPSKTLVHEIMTAPLITVSVSLSLAECAAAMKKHHIHHLPVVDEQGALIGMISATDFLLIAEAMGSGFKDRSLS